MAKNFQDIMAEARKEVPEVSAQQVNELLKNNGKSPVILDVRESDEWRQGHLEGALPLPRGFLEIKVETTVPDKNAPIIAYCAGGVRSLLAAKVMKEMGYQNVSSMAGGYGAWKNGGFKWVQDFQYTPDQLIRYSRHFLLPEVGEDGQAKLLQAKVLLVGAGGLGSPAAYYLAAAGVGTLGIIDNDVVDVSNLQRQILHANDRVGMPKVESAKKTLEALNPDVKVIPYQAKLTSENIMEIIKDYDFVVDGCDNFPTRYLSQRCLRADRQAKRARQHLSVRRPGHGFLSEKRPLLPLPLSRAAAGRAGAELRRSRRVRRIAGLDRRDRSFGSDQAYSRQRRAPGRTLALLQHLDDGDQYAQSAPRSELPRCAAIIRRFMS